MSCCTTLRFVCAALILWLAGALPASGEPKQVVVLYDERTDLPGVSVLHASLTRRLTSGPPGSVEIYREEMDLSRFGSDGYLLRLRDHLRTKYAGRKIDVVVAAYPTALDFLLKHGDAVFPGAPIVFCGIDRRMWGARSLPSHVTGALVKREFAPTLELALRLHPGTERIVFVAGTSEFDALLLKLAREELRDFEDRLAFTYLAALPMRELLTSLSQLPPQTIVLYSTVFRDGAGEHFVPHDVAERVSAAANAPVYGFIDQYLGRGIVGGQLYSLDAHGEEAANLALQILAGTAPSRLPLVEPRATRAMFDWRQLQRWGINEGQLPLEAIVRFRELSLWSEYRLYVIGVVALVALQALMIGSLLLQRVRRRRAELEAQRHRVELAHAGRLATMGELTATIAHEVNQPLGAILANVAAAEMLLESGDARLQDVRQILADVRKDDLRASEVIRRLRALLAKHEMARERLDLNDTIAEVVRLLGAESARRQVELVDRVRRRVAEGPRRPRAPAAGAAEPHRERHGRNDRHARVPAARRRAHCAARGRQRRGRGDRPRARHRAGESVETLRLVLHHQAERHGPRAVDRALDRAGARRPDLGRIGGPRRGDVPVHASGGENRAANDARGAAGMTAREPIVHVVDDDESFRTAVTRLLQVAGYEVRGYASAGDFLISRPGDAPGCLLLDINMPGPSGLDLQAVLADHEIRLPVVFLTGYGDVPMSVRAMKAGAVDFLAKPVEPEPLLRAVRDAIAREAADRTAGGRRRALQALYDSLTPREREVFVGVIAGRLNKQIAGDIGASERTVKAHRAQVLAKMRVGSVAELVRAATDLGLAPPHNG